MWYLITYKWNEKKYLYWVEQIKEHRLQNNKIKGFIINNKEFHTYTHTYTYNIFLT